jgi:hypothetical protein
MAKVQGVKEKLHMPIYDAFFVDTDPPATAPRNTFAGAMTDPRVIRFFVDVQNKTRLETNLQAAGVLPSLNTFEARALRVVASSNGVSLDRQRLLAAANVYRCAPPNPTTETPKPPARADAQDPLFNAIQAEVPVSIAKFRDNILAAAEGYRAADPRPNANQAPVVPASAEAQDLLINTIQTYVAQAGGATNFILPQLIYNSVTTLLVGEKIMIEVPTFWFPSGAGVTSSNGAVDNHGEPDPMATFRFAEPVFIEPQQNFRVEMAFPRGVPGAGPGAPPGTLANTKGPLRIWVVLDGYLTRDVQ